MSEAQSVNYVFEALAPASVPVAESAEEFPVHRVYCVGRNYAAHAQEMGFDAREPPFFFCKPHDSLVPARDGAAAAVKYPSQTADYQYEIELVAAIGRRGSDIAAERARDYVWGYAVGLDMTRRDLQLAARNQGRPWELGKAFDDSAPIAPLRRSAVIGHPAAGAIWLHVDGRERQRSDLAKMLWSVPELIAQLSKYFELRPGDLIFTGTPAGVGAVQRGQSLAGGIDGLGELSVRVI